MRVGDKVEIKDASFGYPWKRELIGYEGTVDEVSGDAVAVRIHSEGRGDLHPVWMNKGCLEVRS